MADKPITRKELFLAKAGGQDVKTPEPITREERFLAAIAQGGGSGGGSGLPDASGQADNTALSVQSGAWAASGEVLPEITPENQTVVFAEQSVSFSGPAGGPYVGMLQGVSIASGVTYTVTWNGTTYTCVGSEISMDGETGVFVGNLSIYGIGENTGEPFLFTYGSGLTGTNVITTTAGPHTISVAVGTPQTPADGSVMIVQNGAWVAASLANLVHAIEK